ncbi:hypothetical protein [Glycomyces tarimensis]
MSSRASRRRPEAAAAALGPSELPRAANGFVHLSKALASDDGAAQVEAWTDAAIRLLVTAELH